ncbi:MAG: inclusion body family protein [Paucimonas sp.]|nr:inclusion body family protein [Paucimonas sp.]
MTNAIIDVLLLVDADNLISTGNVENSVSLVVPRNLIDPNASNNELDGGSELWFDVKNGDIVRWRATTLSRNFDTTALISNIIRGDNRNGKYGGVLSPPSFLTFTDVPVAYLKDQTPSFGSTATTVSVWQATASAPGKLFYKIEFYLLDRESKVVGGPYSWDPYITINN